MTVSGTRMREAAVVACVATVLGWSGAASAQSTSAAAEQLFQDAKRLLDAGKTHEACEKFAASQEAEPGLGTLLHLASCHEKEGKNASAWAEFTDAAAQAQNRAEKDREKFARDHAHALEKTLHRVSIEMTQRPDGLEVRLDGKRFPNATLGTAIPLDPGEHMLEAQAPHKQKWTQKVAVSGTAGVDKVTIPPLADEPEAPQPAAAKPAETKAGATAPVEDPGSPGKRTVGFVVGGLGLALVGLAVVEGLTVSSKSSEADDHFRAALSPNGTIKDQAEWNLGVDAHDGAKNAQLLMFISGGVGVAALGVGAFLIATSYGSSPKTGTVTVRPTVGLGSVGLTGAF